MKTSHIRIGAMTVIAAGTLAANASAAIITIDTAGGPAPSANSSFSIAVGQTLHLAWFARTSDNSGNEAINGLGLSLLGQSSDGGALTASNFSIANPGGSFSKRWAGTNLNGGLNNSGFLINDSRAVTTSPTANSISSTTLQYATFDLTATAPGTISLFTEVSPLGISETNTNPSTNTNVTSNFGFGDAPVSNSVANVPSAIADAVITVNTPEPTSLGLGGMLAGGMLLRRRGLKTKN